MEWVRDHDHLLALIFIVVIVALDLAFA